MKPSFPVRLLRSGLRKLKTFVTQNETARKLLYDSKNEQIFSNLLWHERMLADTVRMHAYKTGIARNVKPGDVVIDLGTGTGVLAYFASQAGAKKIYAIDHSDFIETAKHIAEKNGYTNVEFVQKNSREYAPPEPADVLIHEQIDRDLFGENMIENLLDMKARTLKPDGRVLPGLFEFYVEPLVVKKEFRVPHLWEFDDLGFDLSFLKDSQLIERYKLDDYGLEEIKTHNADYFLCDPEPLIRFDINTMKSRDDIPKKFEVSRRVVREGSLDGFVIYFRAIFDEETILDTSPMKQQTHWLNLVMRTERKHFKAGDRIAWSVDLPVLVDRTTWRLVLRNETSS